MSTPEMRHKSFVSSYNSLGINRAEMARLFNLGEGVTKSSRNRVGDKLNGVYGKGITKPEALASELLVLVSSLGVKTSDIGFNDDGSIVNNGISAGLHTEQSLTCLADNQGYELKRIGYANVGEMLIVLTKEGKFPKSFILASNEAGNLYKHVL